MMKLATHPNTCAWPCAWSHAGEIDPMLSRPLICSRFHTPRSVPGNSMKKRPLVTKAISKRDNASSRARVSAKICAGESAGPIGADDAVANSAGEVAIVARLRPSRLPCRQRVGRECCSRDVRGGGGLSPTPPDLDTQPDNWCRHQLEPYIHR